VVRLSVKIGIFLLINFFVLKGLYLNQINRLTHSRTLIRQVYSQQDYRYWSKEDGKKYCKEMGMLEQEAVYTDLSRYADKKTNVIYFQNVDLIECKEFIQKIAVEFHKRNLEIAFDLEKKFEADKFFTGKFENFDTKYYSEKFKEMGFVSDWVDYIVFNNAMEYLTYSERRTIQTTLRSIFTKPYIGFRFENGMDIEPSSVHPVRNNKFMVDFIPMDDDGDFIIINFPVDSFKRTMVFAEDKEIYRVGINGEFVD
jgi:hypothetical protein